MNVHLTNAAFPGMPTDGIRTSDARLITRTAPGGGVLGFSVSAGDRIVLQNVEGLQPATLLVARLGGYPAAEVFGSPEAAIDLDALLSQTVDGGAEARAAIRAAGIAPDALAAVALFDGSAEAGAEIALEAAADALLILVAPAAPMNPEDQATASDIRIEITTLGSLAGIAPPPLAEPKLDLRIDAATAKAYRVRAGDYIQIIDVDGRQCSDFLAFDAKALDEEGRVYGLDATTTHTLMNSATPGPGLHSKYYDERMVPLIEVVRDTVGRHDTFMLACTAKYYDDMGYPGHSNCTDNFNAVLPPFGIEPRMGWPAINFFFNTFVDAHNQIGSDVPWSRPGDYVLLRAMTDLVCASSSCADDIDPANGWLPTDIHIRVYDASANFSKGIAHRMTPDAEPRLTRESAFHPRTSALTRAFTDYRGFWLADCYSDAGPIAEYWACREKAAITDLSALRKFEITGPDAEALMQLAVPRDVKKLSIGQIVYTALCYETGGMIDDGTIFRLGPHNFRWVCGDDYAGVWLRELAETHRLNAFVRSSTDQLHNLAIQGPASRAILAAIVSTPPAQATIAELKWFRFSVGRIGGAQGIPVVVSRTGYTGELGYEVWCHPKDGPAVWDAILEAGRPHGLMPMGLHALDCVRIEAGLAFAGSEFCDQTDPFEAGIGFSVPAAKTDPYIGKAALERRRAHPMKALVGLDIDGAEPIHAGDGLYAGRAQVGHVTSATRSPVLGRTIALARVDVSASRLGTRLEIGKLDGHQKRIGAGVVRFPHYDPEKTRVRS